MPLVVVKVVAPTQLAAYTATSRVGYVDPTRMRWPVAPLTRSAWFWSAGWRR